MKIQKYHLLLIITLFVLTSCSLTKKKGCNTCPNFSAHIGVNMDDHVTLD